MWKIVNHKYALHKCSFYKMLLSCYYGDFVEASNEGEHLHPEDDPNDEWPTFRMFFQGLTSLALVTEKKPPKSWNRGMGKFVIKKFRKWSKEGAVNVTNMLLILEAEQLAGSKRAKPDDVRAAYDKGISAASALGCLHHKGLAQERAGVYFSRQGNQKLGAKFWKRSHKTFKEWGAMGKVRDIERKYGGCLFRNGKE